MHLTTARGPGAYGGDNVTLTWHTAFGVVAVDWCRSSPDMPWSLGGTGKRIAGPTENGELCYEFIEDGRDGNTRVLCGAAVEIMPPKSDDVEFEGMDHVLCEEGEDSF